MEKIIPEKRRKWSTMLNTMDVKVYASERTKPYCDVTLSGRGTSARKIYNDLIGSWDMRS